MELRHLRYFVTVADELHFGRAASKLHISQPPLSMQIRDLEREVGVELLSRTKRRVMLTQAGSAFLDEAKDILKRVNRAKTSAQQAARGETGNLTIGFISLADYNLMPYVLREFQKEYPSVSLGLREATTDIQLTDLTSGTIDIGFLLPPVNIIGINSLRISKENLIAVLPSSHPQASKKHAISIKSLASSPFIMTPRRHAPSLYDGIIRFCEKFKVYPSITQEAIQMQTIVSLVSAEMGISLIPESIQKLQRKGVVYKKLKETTPKVEIHLAWKESNQLPSLVRFLEFTRKSLKTYVDK
ncbi:LysR family transcriptional regulator [Burkholderiales bacterium]|nr:LysR family transcriptional regulator [Burkholderiales bacterium]